MTLRELGQLLAILSISAILVSAAAVALGVSLVNAALPIPTPIPTDYQLPTLEEP